VRDDTFSENVVLAIYIGGQERRDRKHPNQKNFASGFNKTSHLLHVVANDYPISWFPCLRFIRGKWKSLMVVIIDT